MGVARITCLLGAGAAVEIGVLYQRMVVFGGICVDFRRLLANIKKEIFTFVRINTFGFFTEIPWNSAVDRGRILYLSVGCDNHLSGKTKSQ